MLLKFPISLKSTGHLLIPANLLMFRNQWLSIPNENIYCLWVTSLQTQNTLAIAAKWAYDFSLKNAKFSTGSQRKWPPVNCSFICSCQYQ